MKAKPTITVVTVSALGLMAIAGYMLSGGPRAGHALAPNDRPATVRIAGIVRDFKSDHPDFGYVPSAGYGHYAGNIAHTLGPEGTPMFMEPSMALTDFKIVGDTVVPNQDFAVRLTVLGAAISNNTYHLPVTMRAKVGTQPYEPFGAFTTPVQSNLNDNASVTGNALPGSNPRSYVLPEIYAAGAVISIAGQSWVKTSSGNNGLQNGDWKTHLSADSATPSNRVYALRHGDPVPNTAGWSGQASIADYVEDYVDLATKTMSLQANEVIWLFELGTTDLSSGAADFQDLVVLIELASSTSHFTNPTSTAGTVGTLTPHGYKVNLPWRDARGNNIAPHLAANGTIDACGNAISDTPGLAGAKSTGALTNAANFQHWFQNVMGINLSSHHTITLTDVGDGVWEYKTQEFYPADNILMGNEGEERNFFFTYQFDVNFVYNTCTSKFFEFAGSDDAWVFVNGQLVLDLGGVVAKTRQRIDLDRLGLADGQPCTLSFFYAQRQTTFADFHIRTNILMAQQHVPPTISAGYD